MRRAMAVGTERLCIFDGIFATVCKGYAVVNFEIGRAVRTAHKRRRFSAPTANTVRLDQYLRHHIRVPAEDRGRHLDSPRKSRSRCKPGAALLGASPERVLDRHFELPGCFRQRVGLLALQRKLVDVDQPCFAANPTAWLDLQPPCTSVDLRAPIVAVKNMGQRAAPRLDVLEHSEDRDAPIQCEFQSAPVRTPGRAGSAGRWSAKTIPECSVRPVFRDTGLGTYSPALFISGAVIIPNCSDQQCRLALTSLTHAHVEADQCWPGANAPSARKAALCGVAKMVGKSAIYCTE